MDKNDAILYQVSFKGAIDIVAAGEVETDDVLGEVFALTDAFYEGLKTKIGTVTESGGSGNGGKTFTKKPSGSFKKQGSTQGGNSSGGQFQIKNPDAPATEAQIRKLQSLGYDGNTSSLTKGEASDAIQARMG